MLNGQLFYSNDDMITSAMFRSFARHFRQLKYKPILLEFFPPTNALPRFSACEQHTP